MKFSITRDLTNEVYSVRFTFDSFGSEDMSAEDELKILDDHGPAQVNIGGKFIGVYCDGDISVGEYNGDNTLPDNAVQIDFVRNYETIDIVEGMTIDYKIAANSIIMTDKLIEIFETKNKVAEAKAELFVATIKERLINAVTEWRKLATDFDANNPEDFVI